MIQSQSSLNQTSKTEQQFSPNPDIDRVIHELLGLGFSPLPVAPGRKNPSFINEKGEIENIKHSLYRHDRPSDSELKRWFSDARVGIGTNGGAWLDFDLKHFKNAEHLEQVIQPIVTRAEWVERTQSGGYRVAIAPGEKPDFTNFGIADCAHAGELLNGGGFVVLAPTKGANGEYRRLKFGPPLKLARVDDLGLRPSRSPVAKASPPPIKSKPTPPHVGNGVVDLRSLISKAAAAILEGKAEDGDRSKSLAKLARETYGWQNLAGEVGIPVSSAEAVITEAAEALGIADKSSRCLQSVDSSRCRPGLERGRGHQACISKLRRSLTVQKVVGDSDSSGKLQKLNKVELHKFLSDRHNIQSDVWTDELLVDGVECEAETFHVKLALEHGVDVGKDASIDVLTYIGQENPKDDVLQYLDSLRDAEALPREIFENRLANFCFGIAEEFDNLALKKFLISAVARAYDPGCKADECPIFQGAQGTGKSSFLRIMGGDFFNENLNLSGGSDDEARSKMRRSWIHEIAEFDKLTGKREASEVKAFTSEAVDNYRPKYARKPKIFKRRCVMAGTANPPQFLVDPTGNRRNPIIKIRKRIDLAKIEQYRDQIWAAAVQAYFRGESWHYDAEETALINKRAEEFAFEDPWDSAVMSYLESRDIVTISGILQHALSIEPAKQNTKETGRVVKILTRLGWTKGNRRRLDGKLCYPWYAPPTPCQIELEGCESIEAFNDILRRYTQFDIDKVLPLLSDENREKIEAFSKESQEAEINEAALMVAEVFKESPPDALDIFDKFGSPKRDFIWVRLSSEIKGELYRISEERQKNHETGSTALFSSQSTG